MSIVSKKISLTKVKQIEKDYFRPWEKRLKAWESDLMKRQVEIQKFCEKDIGLLDTYKAKLRKFNYQLAVCEVLGLDRIDRIDNHLHRKITQYNDYFKMQKLICESHQVDLAFIIEEHALLHKERSQFNKEKQLLNKCKV
jgi:hypothetical protein